jgi:hypothetical protein
MAAARHFPSLLPSPSPLPPPWLSLCCHVYASASCLFNSASAAASALPINTPPPLVPWRLSSHLPLFAGWFLHCLLSRCLRLASPFIAQPTLTSSLDPPSLFVLAGCCVESCSTASASQRATGSHVASCDTSSSHLPTCPLLHRHFCRPLS